MALLDGKTHKEYYEGNNLGGYQFVSLQDVIAHVDRWPQYHLGSDGEQGFVV